MGSEYYNFFEKIISKMVRSHSGPESCENCFFRVIIFFKKTSTDN